MSPKTLAQSFAKAPRVKVLSCGGGLDSFALLVNAVTRDELPDVVIFCDVADPAHDQPGEWPSTYRHLREVVIPFCEKHGIEFVWLTTDEYPVRDADSLFTWLDDRGQIPVAGPSRICTTIAKVERYERWMQDRFPGQDVETWIGFEANETSRAKNDPYSKLDRKVKPGQARRINRFPLIEQGLCRCRCETLVRDAGFPVPRKSACTFCPYGSKGDWQTLARELPETFARIEAMEAKKLANPTKRNGVRMSIMGYGKRAPWNKKGVKLPPNPERGVDYNAPTLAEFIDKPYKPAKKSCQVCGQAQRATKATGCSYLDEVVVKAA